MKGLQVSLNQTQRVRLQSALQKFEDIASKTTAAITVSDTIPVNNEDGILKGHGTMEFKTVELSTLEPRSDVVATLCGVVERVNKLVYVRSHRARYKPEVGDIIVGRVIEIAPKRWKLEINFSQDAVLMLSSMNLPDGIQRRRTAVDELNMRSIFEENDVVCAEVRGLQHDGSLQLQARSQKYGKLEKGQMLTVPAYLVKRRKHHFHHLEQYGVVLILGCNGYIWVGEHVQTRENDTVEDRNNKPDGTQDRSLPLETRQFVCRIANAVRLLAALGFVISVEVILDAVEASISSNVDIKDMLGAEFYVQMAEKEVQRRFLQLKRRG